MYNHSWTPALLLMVLFAMQSTASNAESPIGVAASIKPNAEGIIGANSRMLAPGAELYANETVRTGTRGEADLVFIDNANLTVGPTSEVLLDKFVYDPVGALRSVVVTQATRGAFRLVTGSQDHRVNTSYGTLNVRGTHQRVGPGALGFAEPAALDLKPGDSVALSARTVVEVVVVDKNKAVCQNGRPPEPGKKCAHDCKEIVHLVEGTGATYTSDKTGKTTNLSGEGAGACISDAGVFLFTSSKSILVGMGGTATPQSGGGSTPPGSGGTTPPTNPPPTCVSPNTLNCTPG